MTLNVSAVDELQRTFTGDLLMPDAERYDTARRVWNGMVDRRPALIAQPAHAPDVISAIQFARDNHLEIGVRCGGHSVVGLSVPEGGLMIDLSKMQRVHVNPASRRAHVQGGALLGNLDRASMQHGLATTAGNISHTGVGGLTLGGGMGWLARQFGLACDNVISVDIVTADGDFVHADAEEEPDLFWAVRGGGGNFGVVTDFEFRLHPVNDTVLAADFFYDIADGVAVMRAWREMAPTAPRQATFTAWVGNAPEWPFLPPEDHGRLMVNAGFVWVGDIAEGRKLVDTFRSVARPITEKIEETTYLGIQTAFDHGNRHGLRRYWKGYYLRELSDGAIDAFLGRGDAGGDGSFPANAGFQTYGGAIPEMTGGDASFGHRDAVFEFTTSLGWEDPAEDYTRIEGARKFGQAMEPYSSGVYVNSLSDEGDTGVEAAYSEERLRRLVGIKGRYDPDNVFHLNHNIKPSSAA